MQPPPGYWQFVPVQPQPEAPPMHPWYDYLILGLAIAYITFVFAVQIFYGITLA